MPMDGVNTSTIVPSTNEEGCCGGVMTRLQHIQSWLNTFLAIPEYLRSNFMPEMLRILLALAFIKSLFSNTKAVLKLLTFKSYRRLSPDLFIFDSLQPAFAKGILNTKLY